MNDSLPHYPDNIEIRPLDRPPNTAVTVPGSKSITNRALVPAAIARMDVDVTIRGAVQCEDTEVMVNCLARLGIALEPDWSNQVVFFPFQERLRIPAKEADLYVANSGTTLRFLTAAVVTCEGRYRLDGTLR